MVFSARPLNWGVAIYHALQLRGGGFAFLALAPPRKGTLQVEGPVPNLAIIASLRYHVSLDVTAIPGASVIASRSQSAKRALRLLTNCVNGYVSDVSDLPSVPLRKGRASFSTQSVGLHIDSEVAKSVDGYPESSLRRETDRLAGRLVTW